MRIKCFAAASVLALHAAGVNLEHRHKEDAGEMLTQTEVEEMFDNIKRLTSTYEYELPALGPIYAGRPLGALMDLKAIMNPELITDENKESVCRLARTLGVIQMDPTESINSDQKISTIDGVDLEALCKDVLK